MEPTVNDNGAKTTSVNNSPTDSASINLITEKITELSTSLQNGAIEPCDNYVEKSSDDNAVPCSTDNCPFRVKYEWTDITKEFTDACSQLELGELVHDAHFGLFEGMSAIEMMDPKMDAGMMSNQTKRKVLNLQQSVEAGSVLVEGFTNSDLIGIMDETFACLATWLEGHSLAQTVFINLYLHEPLLIKDRTLKAFALCFLKLVDVIRDRINRANVYEEEDFHSLTYGFKMAGDESDASVMSSVREVEEELGRIIKMTRLKSGSERDEATQLEHEHCVGLNARLKFTRLFLLTITAFCKEKCQGVEEGLKYISQMKDLVEQMRQTIHLGASAVTDDSPSAEPDRPRAMGFGPLINQRLLPPTFPRYTTICSRPEMVDYFAVLIQRLGQFSDVVPLLDNFHSLVDFCAEFSRQCPCLLSRSLLQSICVPPGGRYFGSRPTLDMLKDAVRSFCAAPALMPKNVLYNNPAVRECIDTFLSHAVRPMTVMIQICGHNRARQRDKWARLLEELALLHDEADRTDAFIHTLMLRHDASFMYHACFSTWTLYHTLNVMTHHTVSGLELELFLPHEYQYIFWYLCEGLYNWLTTTLSRASSFLMEQEQMSSKEKGGKASKKNKRGKKKSSSIHQAEITHTQALQMMCAGYYKAVIGLLMDGKIQRPKFDFDCEEFRYNHRFSQFVCLNTPPMLPYAQFKDSTDITRYNPPLESSKLFSSSANSFQQSRLHLENISNPSDEVQTLLKIVKTNFVVVSLLCKGHKRESKVPIQFDFSLHKLFPVLKIP